MFALVVEEIWKVFALSAPGLLLGFGIAGLLHAFVPLSLIEKLLSKPGWRSTLKASAIGVPLPLCSCSVIPVAVALRRGGASKGATTSFLISTPEIGVDSFILSNILLGPFISVMRVVAAFTSALIVGVTVDATDTDHTNKPHNREATPPPCCDIPDSAPDLPKNEPTPSRLMPRIIQGIFYGYLRLVDDLSVLILMGIVSAGIISALVPTELFSSLHLPTFATVILMLFISLPLYVCATSSTPLAMVFLAKGVPLGAVLTFLLAGPASNITTMLAVKRELGAKALTIYIVGLALLSVSFGLITEALIVRDIRQVITEQYSLSPHDHHTMATSIWPTAILSLLLLASFIRRISKRLKRRSTTQLPQSAKECCCCHHDQ